MPALPCEWRVYACGIPIGRAKSWSSRRAERCDVPAPNPLRPFIDPLERLGLPYCVTGSVAASIYGEPRLTADIDVVLLLQAQDIENLCAVFPEEVYYVPPEETLLAETQRTVPGMFNLIHHATQFKADIYIAAHDSLHQWALEHRRRIDLDGVGMWVAPPEYVIIRKLEYLREGQSDKHVRDIRFMLAATAVDLALIGREVEQRDLEREWARCV